MKRYIGDEYKVINVAVTTDCELQVVLRKKSFLIKYM